MSAIFLSKTFISEKINKNIFSIPSAKLLNGTVQLGNLALEESYAEKLSQVPGLGGLPGPLFKSSAPLDLTESETEYVVRCIKHTFPHHLLVQV